jgi:hypothetical protein
MRKLLKALGLLKARFNRRLSAQQHHYTYWQHFKKRGRRGDKVRAKYHRVRFERNRKAVIKLAGLTRAKKRELRQWVKDHPKPTVASGTGPYGGSESVEREIERVVEAKRGECSGSEKRSASDPLSIANPGSDHNEANTNAYAIDFYLVNDYEIAYIVAAHLTLTGQATTTISTPSGAARRSAFSSSLERTAPAPTSIRERRAREPLGTLEDCPQACTGA